MGYKQNPSGLLSHDKDLCVDCGKRIATAIDIAINNLKVKDIEEI